MEMVSPPPPPPLPPPPPHVKPPFKVRPTPTPQACAIPFSPGVTYSVQETNEPLDLQGGAASAQFPEQNGLVSPPLQAQEDSQSDDEEKHYPVQETNPAPQENESPRNFEIADYGDQHGALGQMNEAEDDFLPLGS